MTIKDDRCPPSRSPSPSGLPKSSGLRRDGAAVVGGFRGEGSARLVSWLAVAVLIAILLVSTVFGGERRIGFYGMFVTDPLGVFMKALVLVGSAVSIILALHYNEQARIARFEFPVLILLATTGMMVMVSANDLITLYLGLELQSSSLCVASFDRSRCARPRPGSSISCSAR